MLTSTDELHPAQPRGIASLLGRISAALERTPALAIVLILLVYIPSALEASRTRPLWHDELFTYWIAQAPTLAVMFHDLHTLDLNPPLVYLLTRLSFHLFGVSTLATRVPEIFGFLVALLALFQFVRTRLGVNFGLFAVALLLASDTAQFAVDARPYTLMLGCLALALTAWQSATTSRKHRLPSLVLLSASLFGMLLSHIFAVLAIGVLILSELDRQRRSRSLGLSPDLPILFALCLPLTAVATYIPMLRNHGASIFPTAFQPTGETIFFFYIASISRELIALLLTALCALVFLRRKYLSPGPPADGPRWFFTPPEWTLIIGLFLAPLALMLELMRTHGAFFPRYGAIETFAVALLTVALLARWTISPAGRPDPRAALLGFLIILVTSGLWLTLPKQAAAHTLIPTAANSEPPLEPCQACEQTAALNPNIPLVDASGLTFIEMAHRESPATLSRVFYLTDPVASARYAHANIFEQEALIAQSFHLAGHVEPYSNFIAEHPHFFVFGTYDYPEDWLLRKLNADHANITVVSHTADDYMSKELYEVQIVPSVRSK